MTLLKDNGEDDDKETFQQVKRQRSIITDFLSNELQTDQDKQRGKAGDFMLQEIDEEENMPEIPSLALFKGLSLASRKESTNERKEENSSPSKQDLNVPSPIIKPKLSKDAAVIDNLRTMTSDVLKYISNFQLICY